MSFAVGEAINKAEYAGAGEAPPAVQYSASAVARLCSSIEAYSDRGAQVWAAVPECSSSSFGSGFQGYAARLNKAVESRRAAAAGRYVQVAEYAPAVVTQWQQFDEIDADNRQQIKIVGDFA